MSPMDHVLFLVALGLTVLGSATLCRHAYDLDRVRPSLAFMTIWAMPCNLPDAESPLAIDVPVIWGGTATLPSAF